MNDAMGNQIDLTWTGSRLDSIEFGGQCATLDGCAGGMTEPHLVRVGFQYVARQHPSVDFADGIADWRGQWLDSIHVESRLDGSAAFKLRNTYEIEATAEADRGRLLTAVLAHGTRWEGSVELPVDRTLVTLEYTDWDPNAVAPVVEAAAPKHLSYRSTTPLQINDDLDPVFSVTLSETKETVPVVDRSGDGLPDFTYTYSQRDWGLYEPSHTNWLVRDEASGPVPEALEYKYSLDGSGFAGTTGLDHPTTISGLCAATSGEPYGKTARYGASVHVDVDGDGLLDIIDSDHQPVILDGYSAGNPDYCSQNANGSLSTHWYVTYRAGRVDAFTVEYAPPVGFPSVGSPERTLVNDGNIVEQVPLAKRALDGDIELFDMNGDGWLDVVKVSSGEIRVHLKGPNYSVEGHQWAGQSVSWNPTGSLVVDALSERLQLHDPDDVGEFHSGRVVKTMAISGLRDMNGDGLVDFVRTCDLAEQYPEGDYSWCGSIKEHASGIPGENWQVWYNTGSRFEDTATIWTIPSGAVPFLSEVDEGANQVQQCQVSGGAPGFDVPVLEDPVSGGDLINGILGWSDAITVTVDPDELPDNDKDGIPDEQDDTNGDGEPFGTPNNWDQLNFPGWTWNVENGPPQYDRDIPEMPDFQVGVDGGTISGGCSGDSTFRRGQRVLSNLVDWDADGRVDFVDAQAGVWYRNLGDGFSTARALPDWMPRALQEFYGIQWLIQDANANPNDLRPDVWGSQAHSQEMWRVQDWNNDGLLDLVVPYAGYVSHLGEPEEYFPKGVTFGQETPPGLLRRITVETGAQTDLGYTASAYMYPSGIRGGLDARSPQYQSMVERRSLLTSIAIQDPVTQQGSVRDIEYSDGVCELGQCLGFEQIVATDSKTARTVGGPLDEVLWSETTTEFVLARDHQVPDHVVVRTDHARTHLPGAMGPADLQPTFESSTTFSSDPLAIPLGEIPNLWVESQAFIEYAEDGTGSREWSVELLRNPVGLPTKVLHNPSDTTERIEFFTEWAYNSVGGNESPSHYVPTRQQTRAWDHQLSAFVTVEEGQFAYDGGGYGGATHQRGLLTAQRVCGGPVDQDLCAASDMLEWSFDRTSRGVTAHVVGADGTYVFVENTINGFGFGETVATAEANAVGHVTERSLDEQGRVVSVTDANGIEELLVLDSFGRQTESSRIGAHVQTPELVSRTSYFTDAVPNYTETVTYGQNYQHIPIPRTSYTVLNGFGDVAQSWSPNFSGSAFIIEHSLFDAYGNELLKSSPRTSLAAEVPGGPVLDFSDYVQETYYDAFGTPIWTRTDLAEAAVVTNPAPGVKRTTDAEGYFKEVVADTHGRTTEVREGKNGVGNTAVTGRYEYDGRGRVTRFADKKGDAHRYRFDGAGRLLDVHRQPQGQAEEPYWAYAYEGPRVVRAFEAGEAHDRVRWTYDALGRTTLKEVWDPTTSSWQNYTWVWDSAGGLTWNGVRHKVTDPAGETRFYYDESAPWGDLGRLTSVERENDASLDGVMRYEYDYDFEGRQIFSGSPTDALVWSLYTNTGWKSSDQVTSWNLFKAEFGYSYDDRGLLDGWSMGRNPSADVNFSANAV
ncbi:MAG: hypothetical protein H6737_07160, partial [Alphaproteobacteria bacterium]|nr:hypothetical protein [Alphaproteobacteria bacterium]